MNTKCWRKESGSAESCQTNPQNYWKKERDTMEKVQLTPIKAIRAKCLDCMAGQVKEVRLCPSEDCSLFNYRFGKNPNRKGIGGKADAFKVKSAFER